jgi:hypothetical protein
MLSDPPAFGSRMRYVDLPPAELAAYVTLLTRCASELEALYRRLDRAALPTALHGAYARGLDQALAVMTTEMRAISTELRSRLYAIRPTSAQ